MDPPKYFGSNVDEEPQDFLDEVYKIFFAMGLVLRKRLSLLPINLKKWLRHGTICGRIVGC